MVINSRNILDIVESNRFQLYLTFDVADLWILGNWANSIIKSYEWTTVVSISLFKWCS